MAHNAEMLSVELAHALRSAGLIWKPQPGDHFVIAERDMDDDVFVLSHMTIEVHDFPDGRVLGFNGTTEWALDSIPQQDALWLPTEHQLRELLGGLFVRLERQQVPAGVQFSVAIRTPVGEQRFTDPDPGEAYGRALLAVLREVSA